MTLEIKILALEHQIHTLENVNDIDEIRAEILRLPGKGNQIDLLQKLTDRLREAFLYV